MHAAPCPPYRPLTAIWPGAHVRTAAHAHHAFAPARSIAVDHDYFAVHGFSVHRAVTVVCVLGVRVHHAANGGPSDTCQEDERGDALHEDLVLTMVTEVASVAPSEEAAEIAGLRPVAPDKSRPASQLVSATDSIQFARTVSATRAAVAAIAARPAIARIGQNVDQTARLTIRIGAIEAQQACADHTLVITAGGNGVDQPAWIAGFVAAAVGGIFPQHALPVAGFSLRAAALTDLTRCLRPASRSSTQARGRDDQLDG